MNIQSKRKEQVWNQKKKKQQMSSLNAEDEVQIDGKAFAFRPRFSVSLNSALYGFSQFFLHSFFASLFAFSSLCFRPFLSVFLLSLLTLFSFQSQGVAALFLKDERGLRLL